MPKRSNHATRSTSTVRLPQLSPGRTNTTTPAGPRRHYSRWRAASLIGVHVLIALHIVHWRLAGQTLAPLELNEVMYTLELGIVTAGFVFMALIVLSAAIFGRFFCSWGCHILALQDLCAWILRKLRIRAKPVRSRVLLLVGPGAMLYMFVWPHVRKLIEGKALPTFHLRDDAGGWASFVTDDFWRNLPGPGVALLTFAICGFVIIYVLGTRSFCLYACPYGAIFGVADRIAPGRIKLIADDCSQCGICTSVCESHVRVHEEIAEYGSVVDPACLKDLDCVAACPDQALSFGWTRPSLLRSLRPYRRRLPYDFTLGEDLLMAAVFLASLVIFRGLYGLVPFLLSLAIGGILAYFAVLTVRLLGGSDNVRFNRFQLKIKDRITPHGRVFIIFAIMIGAFIVHSAFIRHHEVSGLRAFERATMLFESNGDAAHIEAASREALDHFMFCDRWGLLTAPGHHQRMASACWGVGDTRAAEEHWRLAIERDADDQHSRLYLATSLLQRGRADSAVPLLQQLTAAREHSRKDAARYAHYRASAWQMLGSIAAARGDQPAARNAFQAAAAEYGAAHRALQSSDTTTR